ncbi:MAG: DUF4493 domain-containing protein [Bacteroidales bacterium]|nr:DUF4493 domain-containing protein [Bacteroidales bacterium]
MFRKLLHILAAAYVLVGCDTALLENAGVSGWLAVDLSCGDDTKAGGSAFAGYPVSINGKTLDYSLESTCGELPALLELAPGGYEIHVSSPNAAPAAFDTPIYSSSEDFTIEAGKTSSVSVVLSTVQVTLLPSSTFNTSTVASCSVTVSNGEASLTWNLADVAAERTGYFKEASVLYISLEGVAKNGNVLKFNSAIYDVAPSDHHRITLGEYVPTI